MSEQIETTDANYDDAHRLRRVLTKWDAVALMIGIMIGSGIFATPPVIAQSIDRFGPMIALWLLGGLVAVCGALSYAELSTMFPRTGGSYVFLRETYGPGPAFVYGWSALLITYPASVAAVAVVFSAYLSRLPYMDGINQSVVAATLALGFCGINAIGVVLGARVQRTFTAAKVLALAGIVGLALLVGQGEWQNLTPLLAVPSTGWSATTLALGFAAVMWTFEGWTAGPSLAGEVKDIRRDMPRALILATGLVTVIYVLANGAFVYVLGIAGVAASDYVAVDAAEALFGIGGAVFVTVLVLVSTAGSVNGMAIDGSRVFFALARDGLFFERVGRAHPRFRTPAWALGILGVVSAVYCLVGTFQQIMQYFVFVATIWSVLVLIAVIILRRRRPNVERPYRVFAYPLPVAIALVVQLGLMYQLFVDNTRNALIGLGILAVAVPVYLIWQSVGRTRDAGGEP